VPGGRYFAGGLPQSPKRQEGQQINLCSEIITFIPNSYKSHVNNIEVYVLASQEKHGHLFSFFSAILPCCPCLTPSCLELDVLKQTVFFCRGFQTHRIWYCMPALIK